MTRGKVVRVGPRWLQYRDIMKQNGVCFKDSELADSTADFLMRENLLPIVVKRAKKNKRLLF